MKKFTELLKLLHGYNQDITVREIIEHIQPFSELEKKNEELSQMCEVRNLNAKEYEYNPQKVEELKGKVEESEDDEDKKEIVEKIKEPYKLTHEERINLLGVDKELDKQITEARSKVLTFPELDRKKINKLTDDYYKEHRCEETDEDLLEDDGCDRNISEEDGDSEESENVLQYCSKCKKVINIDDEIERQNYILFGLCKSCSSKRNKK